MLSILGKIDWLVAVAQHHPVRNLCGGLSHSVRPFPKCHVVFAQLDGLDGFVASGHMVALVVHMGSEICTRLGRWVTHIFVYAVGELLWDR